MKTRAWRREMLACSAAAAAILLLASPAIAQTKYPARCAAHPLLTVGTISGNPP